MSTKNTARKLQLTSRAKMGAARKGKKVAAVVTDLSDLKTALVASVEQMAEQIPAGPGVEGDLDLASIGELVAPVPAPANGKKAARAPLTEAECAEAGDAWINAKAGRLERYGVVEASTPVHDGKVGLTTTNFHDLEVDVATGRVRYVGVNPARPETKAKGARQQIKETVAQVRADNAAAHERRMEECTTAAEAASGIELIKHEGTGWYDLQLGGEVIGACFRSTVKGKSCWRAEGTDRIKEGDERRIAFGSTPSTAASALAALIA
jgi:hypothetical protein